MNKNDVYSHLVKDKFPKGIAEVICDIACNGIVCYPNESVLVQVVDKDEYYVADDEIKMGKHWTYCDNIDDFIDGIVYGEDSARRSYCKYYVVNFKEVKPFNGDF